MQEVEDYSNAKAVNDLLAVQRRTFVAAFDELLFAHAAPRLDQLKELKIFERKAHVEDWAWLEREMRLFYASKRVRHLLSQPHSALSDCWTACIAHGALSDCWTAYIEFFGDGT